MDFPELDSLPVTGLDYEATGLKYWDPDFRVFGVGVSQAGHRWYWDIREQPGVVEWLKDTLPRLNTVAAHSAQFEYQCSRVLGVDPRRVNWYCTLVNDCLIDEHSLTYDLEAVAGRWGVTSRKSELQEAMRAALGVRTIDAAMSSLDRAPRDLVSDYGSDDARMAAEVCIHQRYQLDEQQLWEVHALEMQLLPVLADMSWGGVRVDLQAAHAAIPRLDDLEEQLQREIDLIAGRGFNVNSTPQIRAFFKPEQLNRFQWRLIDGTLVGPTKGGKGPSLDQTVMREIQHPLAQKIVALRKVIKLRDTFIRGHIIGSADDDGYVHTTFNQTRTDTDAGTVTGRLSSTDPALQQITKRDKENAALLRAMFLADEDEEWLCEDYSQVDFRCGAHLQNIPAVLQAYRDNPSLDYHQIVSDMTGIPRNAPYAGAPYTKQINLGLSFGAGAGKLAFMMKMPYEIRDRRGKMVYLPGPDAKAVFDKYHTMLPGVKKFMELAENVAKHTGYVRTAIGRRLRYPRHGYHRAAGHLYQAYAADLHKVGLVAVDAAIRKDRLPARLMMSCHDEIGVSMKRNEEVKNKIACAYTDFAEDSPTARIKMRVPITASAKFGANWWEACKED